MPFRLDLPSGCPPDGANKLTVSTRLVRLTKCFPAGPDEFQTLHEQKPSEGFTGFKKCLSMGLSLTDEIGGRRALLTDRWEGHRLTSVELPPDSGVLMKTGSSFDGRHYTFWADAEFNISESQVEDLT